LQLYFKFPATQELREAACEQVAALVEQVSRTPADAVARVRAAMENT
jgi:hypothetical protein